MQGRGTRAGRNGGDPGYWTVRVELSAGSASSEADFAGAGTGTVNGTIVDSNTLAPIRGAVVACRWAGLDDRFRTPDDVLMGAVATPNGDFSLAHMPYGRYSCIGRDPVSGATSTAAEAVVMSRVPTHVVLPVRRSAPLPNTGAPAVTLAILGIGLLLAGGTVLRFGRRRARA